jgi:predicted RNase H-like nuclease
VIGIDGCRGGWIAALVEGDSVSWQITTDVRELIADRQAEAVAIDIPIGLPSITDDNHRRCCDDEARNSPGVRSSSVFPAPVREVLACATYPDARELLATFGEASMSAQAFGIVPAVRKVDEALLPDDEMRVIETHPETAFAVMAGVRAGDSVLPTKKSAVGAALRLQLLSGWRADALDVLACCPVRVPIDDALDALVCAWVAQRWVAGTHQVLGDGARDARGLVMRIVV